jgi:glycosyltransferase involved in cell wall biosynthesis
MTNRIYIFCPHLTPYNDFLFKRIAQAAPNTEVIYRNRSLGSHPWRSNLGEGYSHRYESRWLGIDWYSIRMGVIGRGDFFLVEGWDTPTMQVLLTCLRLLCRNYAVWTDTPNLTRRGPWLREKLRALWLRWIFRGAKASMGTGEPGVRGLEAMGAPQRSLVNFPFVLDLGAYERAEAQGTIPHPMRFVSSGRVQNWLKGHDIAIRAFQIAYERTGLPFEYRIAGTGPDKDALEQLVAEAGLGENIMLLGWVEPVELQNLLRTSDVLIHPSPIQDPFPNSVLEGMASGNAVLGSSVCGSVIDRVIDRETGFVHPPGDVKALAAHIERCLENPSLVTEMGRRNAAIARQWPVERSVEIIKDLAEGRFPPLARLPWPTGA